MTTAVKESDILVHILKLPEKDRTWKESSLKEILEAKLKHKTEMAGGLFFLVQVLLLSSLTYVFWSEISFCFL